MQVTNYTVNALGLQEIRTFLANNHKKGSDHFTGGNDTCLGSGRRR